MDYNWLTPKAQARPAGDKGWGSFAVESINAGETVAAIGMVYEWTHYLVHTDYKAKHGLYRTIWRNHRLHHFKNEHYWYAVTSPGIADRVLGTYPDPQTVPTSPTARNLFAAS